MSSLNLKNKRNWVYPAFVIGYYVWFQMLYNLIANREIFPYPNFNVFIEAVALNFVPICILAISNTLIVFRIVKINRIWLKMCVDVVTSLLLLVIVNIVFALVVKAIYHNFSVDWAGTILNNLMILLINELAYYMRNYRTQQQRANEIMLASTRMQYHVLQTQLSPHFMFNSLNILHSLTYIDIEKSRKFITLLSDIFRYMTDNRSETRVSVSDELDFIRKYGEILNIRYGDSFHIKIINSKNGVGKEIIPYCLQILIENVVKHNVIQASQPMIVTVDIQPTRIEVVNPIHPKRGVDSTKLGLEYISGLYGTMQMNFSYGIENGNFIARIPYL